MEQAKPLLPVCLLGAALRRVEVSFVQDTSPNMRISKSSELFLNAFHCTCYPYSSDHSSVERSSENIMLSSKSYLQKEPLPC